MLMSLTTEQICIKSGCTCLGQEPDDKLQKNSISSVRSCFSFFAFLVFSFDFCFVMQGYIGDLKN